jgi:phytoene/squalene synthetase
VLQVLNHLQDGAKDLQELDRCYIPDDLMVANGASVRDLHKHALAPGLKCVHDDLLARCDALNTAAAELPRRVRDRRLRLECAVITGLARRLAARLKREDPLAARVRLRKPDIFAALFGALRHL